MENLFWSLLALILPFSTWASSDFDKTFYQSLAKAPYIKLNDILSDDRQFLMAQDILDPQMQFRRASASPELQAFIDGVMERVYKAPSGVAFCADDLNLLQRELGVSPQAAVRIHQRCLRSDAAGLYSKVGPKNFYFVTNIPKNAPFHSWTSMFNDTFIFLEEKISEEELVARIIHELAVQADPKLMLATSTVSQLAEHYGYKMKNGFLNSGSDEAIRETVGAMPFPAMKFAGVTLRAMIVESILIEEIFGSSGFHRLKNAEIFSLLKSRQYEKALRNTAKSLLPLQDYLLPVEYSVVPVKERRLVTEAMGQMLYLNEKVVDMIVDNIVKSKITFSSKHGKQSLLEWILTPMVGIEGSFYSRGPRPRIGTGWSELKVGETERVDVLQYEKLFDPKFSKPKFKPNQLNERIPTNPPSRLQKELEKAVQR